MDDIHSQVLGTAVLPVQLRRKVARANWGQPAIRETGFYFPGLHVTSRIQGRQLGRSLVHRDWDAALRLTLWPLAAITERVRGSPSRSPHRPLALLPHVLLGQVIG